MNPSVLRTRTVDRLGWRPDVPDFRDYSYGRLSLEKAPAEPGVLQSRLLKGIPVIDQGQLGSCTGCSVAVMHAAVRRVGMRSALQIYYEARRMIGETDQDNGAYIRDAVKVISSLGAGREGWWPYRAENVFVDPPLKVDRDALLRRVFSYYRLEDAEHYQSCLAAGFPFVIGIAVFSGFMGGDTAAHGVVPLPSTNEIFQGGHAVCVWGYDPDFRHSRWADEAVASGLSRDRLPARAYMVRNSWGGDWGRRGDFAICADYLENSNLADDAWTIRKVAEPPQG